MNGCTYSHQWSQVSSHAKRCMRCGARMTISDDLGPQKGDGDA